MTKRKRARARPPVAKKSTISSNTDPLLSSGLDMENSSVKTASSHGNKSSESSECVPENTGDSAGAAAAADPSLGLKVRGSCGADTKSSTSVDSLKVRIFSRKSRLYKRVCPSVRTSDHLITH